jgi:4-amino-4-deoxy-L-arabinose transferase-like glycosyltransferase
MSRHRLIWLLAGAAILLLAFALRFRGLDTTGLWGDQAFTLNTAMRWVNGGPVPLAANKSSVGIMNPPMIEYLYAAALRLWGDILSVSILTLIGGLVAVAVTGLVTARIYGRRAALWTMLAFAVAPWAVFWSQLIWNQTMVPPFAALALGGLLLYLVEAPRWPWLVASFAAAAAMTQVHPGSAVQVGTIGLCLLLFRQRVVWRHVFAAAAVFALIYLPYLLYQIGTGWTDLRAAGDVAGQEAAFSPAALLLSLDLLRAQGLFRAAPEVTSFDTLAAALFVLSLIAVIIVAVRPGRARGARFDPQRSAAVIILLWFALPLAFYLRASVYLQNYYLIGQWPAQFMILGIGLDAAQRAAARRSTAAASDDSRRGWAAVVWLLPLPFVALFAYQVYFNLVFQDMRAEEGGPDIQVRQARRLLTGANALLAERPECRLVGVGRGHQVETSDLALLEEFTDPERVLLSDGDLGLPLPVPCAVYLNARPGSPAGYWLEANGRPIDGADVDARGTSWRFYDWTAAAETGDLGGALRWANGLALAGIFRGEVVPGRPLDLALTWAVDGRPPARQLNFGAYLLGEGDRVVAQHDGPGFDSVQWREGDRFITWHFLPIPDDLPPGSYQLAVALYTWPELVREELVAGVNTAYLERVDVGER